MASCRGGLLQLRGYGAAASRDPRPPMADVDVADLLVDVVLLPERGIAGNVLVPEPCPIGEGLHGLGPAEQSEVDMNARQRRAVVAVALIVHVAGVAVRRHLVLTVRDVGALALVR